MKKTYTLCQNWHIKIPDSHVHGGYGRGRALLYDNGSTLLAYDEVNSLAETKRGKLIRIKEGKANTVFETEYSLWSLAEDGDGIYVASFGKYGHDVKAEGIVYKLNKSYAQLWQYQLDNSMTTLPVMAEDSIFITDFNYSNRNEHLYRLSKRGDLIFKQTLLGGFTTYELSILEDRKEYIRPIRGLSILQKCDFNGSIKKNKSISELGAVTLSQNSEGNIFASIDNSIVALDDELETIWKYKPEKGWADQAPVFDAHGNAYSMLNMRRLVSLDRKGKENWIVNLFGHGRQPLLTDSGEIITITTMPTGNPDEFEQYTSIMEIFSIKGEKLLEDELPGVHTFGIVHKDTIFAVTNGTRYVSDGMISSVNVFSLRLT